MPAAHRPGAAVRTRHFLTWASAYAILLVLAVLTIFPLVWMALTSFKQPRDVFYGPLLPTSFNLSNYQRVWSGLDFPQHVANSLFVTTMTVLMVLIVGTLAGYAFARFPFPAREWIFYLFLACMMIPGTAILVPMFIFLHQIGLLNSLPGIALSYLGTGLPFAISRRAPSS